MLMSISALSSNLIADLSQQDQQNPFQKIQQDFKQLASDLQSGDLSGAQSAYASIQPHLQHCGAMQPEFLNSRRSLLTKEHRRP